MNTTWETQFLPAHLWSQKPVMILRSQGQIYLFPALKKVLLYRREEEKDMNRIASKVQVKIINVYVVFKGHNSLEECFEEVHAVVTN